MKYYLAIFLALASFGANAALIKWVDKQGMVHYSDSPPPPGVQSQTLNIPDSSGSQGTQAASGVNGEPSIYQQAAEVDKERKAEAEAAKKAAEKRKHAEQEEQACNQARANLITLQSAPRIANYDANGNKYYLSDEAMAQSQIDKYCK